MIKKKNTEILVRNYLDNLTESATSEDFLQQAKILSKPKSKTVTKILKKVDGGNSVINKKIR
jgi:hypothetical protein